MVINVFSFMTIIVKTNVVVPSSNSFSFSFHFFRDFEDFFSPRLGIIIFFHHNIIRFLKSVHIVKPPTMSQKWNKPLFHQDNGLTTALALSDLRETFLLFPVNDSMTSFMQELLPTAWCKDDPTKLETFGAI